MFYTPNGADTVTDIIFEIENINDVFVHTPVICDGTITDKKEYNQKVTPNKLIASIILDKNLHYAIKDVLLDDDRFTDIHDLKLKGKIMRQLDNKSIEANDKIIRFDINISQVVEYKDFFVVLIREKKEIPNNVMAYNYFGEEIWKINDIVQAKKPRGYDEIEKKSDDILIAHYELGIIFEIDVYKRQIVQKTYLR